MLGQTLSSVRADLAPLVPVSGAAVRRRAIAAVRRAGRARVRLRTGACEHLQDRVEGELHLPGVDVLGLLAEDVPAKPLQLDAGQLVELAVLVPLVGRARELVLELTNLLLDRLAHDAVSTREFLLFEGVC